MEKARVTPVNEERFFEPHELFFSLTDPKGVIRYGNDVFTRIAAYDEAELIGAPHNIIRHPDMPRAAFKLLWDYLQSDRTIAAYVKNMAKDGRYYWVVATAMPCKGGYLSVRLKPSSPLFEVVQKMYHRTLQVEKQCEEETGNRKLAIERGVKHLLAEVKAAGFDSYESFMSEMLAAELSSRAELLRASGYTAKRSIDSSGRRGIRQLESTCRLIGTMIGKLFKSVDDFRRLEKQLAAKYDDIQKLGMTLHLLSINASIAASRLGSQGAVLGAVADALSDMSKQMEVSINHRASRLGPLQEACGKLVFGIAVAMFEAEVACDFAIELQTSTDTCHNATVLESLDAMVDEFENRCRDVIVGMRASGEEISRTRREVRELVNRFIEMKAIQINGKAEAANSGANSEFSVIFDEVAKLVDKGRDDSDQLLTVLIACTDRVREFDKLSLSFEFELDALQKSLAMVNEDRLQLAAV
ncbi:PAS domain-containing protein [Aeoliella mucimassa]|uniref:Aerotaxis receptor n=1 Tax=Aeoliella mucimassa TaxID=2527972 RepID=A0A518AUR8_9BACT|nr:PAS domain-containing protein [Aeoliella mucimassa]QDU58473.1 Aerotaxis receptor [Aeoliella mucimassa]